MANIEGRAGRIPPYFRLCHGDKVPMSEIRNESPQTGIAIVKEMIAAGRIVGQYTFEYTSNPGLTTDIILWMPEKNREQST